MVTILSLQAFTLNRETVAHDVASNVVDDTVSYFLNTVFYILMNSAL